MKKQIKRLMENIFNDLYDIDQENNITIEIGDKISYNYHPKTKKELMQLLKKLLDERGPDADLNDIDTSNITDMSELFQHVYPHNIDIRFWDVSNVTDMNNMFWNRTNFNCDLGYWDVSKVTNMSHMFWRCKNFKGQGLDKWDIHNVRDTTEMFFNCENFDCDLKNWNVSMISNMSSMFYYCVKFKGNGLDKWNVRFAENMSQMFLNCIKFDCNLSNWDVSSVIRMDEMFRYCESFKGDGLDEWVPINAVNMSYMFFDCKLFDCNVSKWKVNNVDDMSYMFAGCLKFRGIGLNKWKPEKLKKMSKLDVQAKIHNIFGTGFNLEEIPSWYKKLKY